MEALANAGEVAVGAATAALLGDGLLGAPVGDLGRLLRRSPDPPDLPRTDSPGRPVDLSVAVLVAIREHLLLGAGEPEHRAIAVAFVAFSGTDQMLSERGPVATGIALDACIRNVAHAVADHDVTFFESDINRDGGKIMLTAGAPTSSGHDAERLLRAARLIVDRAADIPLRIGVNFGAVFSGDFGPAFRRTYLVKDDAINLAARLVAKAEPGQILTTDVVLTHSRNRFLTRALPPFAVKGKAKPIAAYVVGPVGAAGGAGSAATASGSPMVGRQHETDVLMQALGSARRRRGGLVQVLGDAGIRKSRLLAELAGTAEGMVVLSMQCDEYESSTPYHPFRVLLRNLLGTPATSDVVAVHRRLSTRVQANASELMPWLPLLGAPLDLVLEETEETEGLGDEFRKRRLEEVVGDFLHLLLPTPTLILLDDAQYMDGASADLLNHLAGRVDAEPWLVVVGGRDDAGGWQPRPGLALTTLRPAPLTAEESVHLVRDAIAAHPLPRPSIVALAARAGGNPLFLESLIRTAGPSGNVEDLPASVQDLVTARVDRLAPVDRALLRSASVFGMRFDTDDLTDLVDGHLPDPEPSTYRRLLEFVEPVTGTTMRFRHALMREVTYEGLPYRTRQQLHDRVGLSLERTDPQRRSPELLSLHFFHAKRFDKAWHYSTLAGGLARAKFANQEAVDLFTRAVESERRGPTGLVSDEELGRLFEALGDTWFTIGLPDQASEAYRKSRRRLANDPVHAARIVAKEARVDQRLRKLLQSLRRVTRAMNALETVPGKSASSARSLLAMRYAISRVGQGRVEDALEWGDRAAREAEDSVDKATLAQSYATLHGIYVAAGRESQLPYGELALQAYTELGDLPGQADCTNNLAVSALDHNRWVEAAPTFGKAAAIYRRIGDTAGEGNAMFNQADVLVRQGHLDRAGALLREALLTARAVSDDELVALVLRETGRVACRTGRFEEGVASLEEAEALFARIGERDELPATEAAICEALLLRGDGEGCLRASDDLVGRVTAAALSALRPSLCALRGFAHLQLDRPDRAVVEFDAGLVASERQDDRYAVALNLLGAARATGDQARRVELEARADTALAALGVVDLPQVRTYGNLTRASWSRSR